MRRAAGEGMLVRARSPSAVFRRHCTLPLCGENPWNLTIQLDNFNSLGTCQAYIRPESNEIKKHILFWRAGTRNSHTIIVLSSLDIQFLWQAVRENTYLLIHISRPLQAQALLLLLLLTAALSHASRPLATH